MIDEETNLGERKKVKNVFEEMNLGLLIYLINKSLIYVLIFIITTVVISWVYLRYTPDIYESSAVLMPKQSKQTQLLGVSHLLKDDDSEVKLEIGLMRSPFLIRRVLDSLNISTEYFVKGRFIESENYLTNPYHVDFRVINAEIEETKIYISFLNEVDFEYNYRIKNTTITDKGKVGQKIENDYFGMTLHLNENVSFDNLENVSFFFKQRNINFLINGIISKIIVQPSLSGSKTLKIVYKSTDKNKARDIIERVSSVFIDYDKEKKTESINSTISFLTEQIDLYDLEFTEFQDSVKQIKISTGFIDPTLNTQLLLDRIELFEEALLNLKYSNKGLNWLKEYLGSNNNLASISPMLVDGNIDGFTSKIARITELERDKELKLLDVTGDHPQIIIINNELSDLRYNLYNQINLVYQKNIDELERISKEKIKLYIDLYNNPDKELLYSRILNENSIRKAFLDDLIQRKSDYLIAKAGIFSDYIYLQKATNPKFPIAPKRMFIKVIGGVIGLLLGILFIVARYLTHTEIVSIAEVGDNCNANVLGVIPKFNASLETSKIVVIDNPKSAITESFRSIRSNLEFIDKQNNQDSKLVVTTSTVPGEGKTFIGINLATIFSLLDKKVIIVDFDLRKPRLAKIFNVENQKGTSTILIGKSTIEECIFSSGTPNLDFIPSGPIPPNPSELISGKVTNTLIQKLQKEYDYVFIDTPPIGLVIDALSLLKKADYPIYVVRADYSNRQFLDNVNKLIFDNKISKLSVVLNDFGRGASGSTYKYGYGYGYGYGSGYGSGYYSDDVEIEKTWSFKIMNVFKK